MPPCHRHTRTSARVAAAGAAVCGARGAIAGATCLGVLVAPPRGVVAETTALGGTSERPSERAPATPGTACTAAAAGVQRSVARRRVARRGAVPRAPAWADLRAARAERAADLTVPA